jgi:hypothetical protein
MTREEVYKILDQYVESVALAKEARFDAVELHGTHGFLINQFMSPFTNKRDDEFGDLLFFPTDWCAVARRSAGRISRLSSALRVTRNYGYMA